MFQSSFELTGYITQISQQISHRYWFQSSFELTGYITEAINAKGIDKKRFQSSFELTGYITGVSMRIIMPTQEVSKLFRAYGLYNKVLNGLSADLILVFQSSFELTGYITGWFIPSPPDIIRVSKLFRAYGLYNYTVGDTCIAFLWFQSSFELTGYITKMLDYLPQRKCVSKLFRAYGLYNSEDEEDVIELPFVSKLFRAYGLYNIHKFFLQHSFYSFQSSFELTGYIT